MRSNTCTGGKGGDGAASDQFRANGLGGGGGAGMGGALFLYSGTITIEQCTIEANIVSGGASGNGGAYGGPGAPAQGAGIFNFGGDFQILRSTLSQNVANGGLGGGGQYSAEGEGFDGYGGEAAGGGVCGLGGSTILTNSTISTNRVVGGNSVMLNAFARLPSPGKVSGGGIRIHQGQLFLRNCTVAFNEAQPGVAIPYQGNPTTAGERRGGGIYATDSSPSLRNTLFAANYLEVVIGTSTTGTPSDGEGTFTSLGNNLVEASAGMTGFVATDKTGLLASIQPLSDNGGATKTHGLAPTSPGLDAGSSEDAPSTDQRGEPRPQGPGIEIGAYEMSALAVKLDNRTVLAGAVTKNLLTTLTFSSPYPTGAIVYTLDGSTPTPASTPYVQPVRLSASATIRAIAYTTDNTPFAVFGSLELTIVPERTLSLSTVGQGSIIPNSAGPYPMGTTVTLTAQPAAGWRFAGWTGDLSGTVSPATITLDSNKTVQATFLELPKYTLAVSKSGQGNVTVSPTTGPYPEGSTVTVTAQPAQGWVFTGWSGDATGTSNPLSLTMSGNKSLAATFRQPATVGSYVDPGIGSVTISPASGPYYIGDTVTFTVYPAAGWQLMSWSGTVEVEGTNPTIQIVLNWKDTSISPILGTTVAANAVGGGAVVVEPELPLYQYGSSIRLSAIPTSGNRFNFWGAPVNSQSNPVSFTITQPNPTFTGVFAALGDNEAALTVIPDGNGTVSQAPSGNSFPIGTTVQLTATPGFDREFVGWSGDATGTANPLSVEMTSSKVIRARFVQPTFNLSVSTIGNGTVEVNSGPSPYPVHTLLSLTARPAVGWEFVEWSGDVSGTQNPTMLFITADSAVTARFAPRTYNLTVSTVGQGTVGISPADSSYPANSGVVLTAQPLPGWEFVGWSGDAMGADNPLTVVMTANKTIAAQVQRSGGMDVVFRSSDPVPGEPEGTSFLTFGNPAINEAGQFAFTTDIQTDQAARIPSLFAVDRLLARKGQPAQNESGGGSSEVLFASFRDPVIDEDGHVAFIATTIARNGRRGSGVWSRDPRVLDNSSLLRSIAVTGSDSPGVLHGRWAKFSSVSVQNGQVLFAATLRHGGGINAKNDDGVWSWTTAGGMKLQLREGVTQVSTPAGPKTVKSFAILTPVAGSLAQGRSHAERTSGSPALAARVTFTDKSQAVLEDDGAGNFRLEALASTGMPINTYTADPALANTPWNAFGFPGWSLDGIRLGFLATMQSVGSKLTSDTGIFVDGTEGRLALRVRKGDQAPDPSASPVAGPTFVSFKDPVIGGSPVEYAFLGRLTGITTTPANDEGLWLGTSEGLRLVAREGQGSDSIPTYAHWKAFQSLALGSARGPLFVADLAPGFGGVTPAAKRGLWGMDSSGRLWPLLRQGDLIAVGDRTAQVNRFTALTPGTGAQGTTRGLSPSGAHIAVQVQLADGTQALVKIEMP
jgi:uncharacterized repeat protein (TIGR02543 family)